MDLDLALVALFFFTAALGFWVATWFLRRRGGRLAIGFACLFAAAGFTVLLFAHATSS